MMRNNSLYIITIIIISLICMVACQSEENITYQRYYVNGKGLYESHCQNCHNSDGTGLKSLYPPLTDSTYLKTNRSKLACIIKYGMKGKVEVNGREFEGNMPANTELSDIDIAQIIVYISNSFGNKQRFYDASEATADLKACPPGID